MTDRRTTPRSIVTRGLVIDVGVVIIWHFMWGHSWAASLACGGVMFVLTCGVAAYTVWWNRNPDRAAKEEAAASRRAEQLARRAASADAAHRSSGRR